MDEKWKQIHADYKKAKFALWCPKHCNGWTRDGETGHYYMWKAYHQARTTEPKDYLIYARILSMMASESRGKEFDYDRYHKYVKPAADAYHLAVRAGQNPSDKELKYSYYEADKLEYILNKRKEPYEDQIRHISGYKLLSDFQFHDSRFVSFEHNDQNALMKLNFDGRVATFLFEDVDTVTAYFDYDNRWVFDFCCYPPFNPDGNTGVRDRGIVFDIEFYKIVCGKVTVISCVNE